MTSIIRPKNHVATWNESRWLLGSSCAFLIPAIYAYRIECYVHSVLSAATFLLSVNYWRKAMYDWRRLVDMVFARIGFAVFALTGLYYIDHPVSIHLSYAVIGGGLYCLTTSEQLYIVNHPRWVNYHMVFHALISFEQLYVIYYLGTGTGTGTCPWSPP